MKSLIGLFVVTALCLPAHAAQNLNAYAGIGPNYIPASAFRIGVSGWEAGVLAPKAFGADYRFVFDKNYYTSLGLALVTSGVNSVGVYGSIGCEYDLFGGFTFRAELNSVTGANGYSQAAGILGAAYHFGGRQ